MGRVLALSIGAVLLAGCSSERISTDYAAITQKVGPPRQGQARIVVLQEKRDGLSLAICACEVKVDGTSIGTVKAGTYVYADRPAGHHELLATETLFPGDTKREIALEAGHTYFFLARASERHNSVTGMTVFAGLAGAVVASAATAASNNPGPADFFPLDEPAARRLLTELQLAD